MLPTNVVYKRSKHHGRYLGGKNGPANSDSVYGAFRGYGPVHILFASVGRAANLTSGNCKHQNLTS